MKRENISAAEARHILKKDDDERRRWSIRVFGMDTWDPMLYDMVLHIKSIKVDDAVALILQAAKLPCFRTTPSSQKILDDQSLAARVQAALVEEFPTARVSAKEGEFFVDIKGDLTKNGVYRSPGPAHRQPSGRDRCQDALPRPPLKPPSKGWARQLVQGRPAGPASGPPEPQGLGAPR